MIMLPCLIIFRTTTLALTVMPGRMSSLTIRTYSSWKMSSPFAICLPACWRPKGHRARKAGNGLEALHEIEEARPNLILLDMMMPVMDGWQFIARMRANDEWKTIPVVLITAVYDMSSLESRTGARAILTKPFDIELIVDAVDLYAE